MELHNYGGSDVNISNWKLKDETPFNSYTIPVGTILSPDEYIVIVQSIDTFLMVHGDVTNYIGEFGYGFDNTSGSVKLEDNSGTVVRLVNYVDSIPVSYTHLRAHETVLDLVCRLLLEKKKTNNSNILT